MKALSNTGGQDLIEYALIAGFLAVIVAAAMPSVSSGVSTIFNQIGSTMTLAAAAGSSALARSAEATESGDFCSWPGGAGIERLRNHGRCIDDRLRICSGEGCD
jgi:pilus assembly protein Flp/PilA